MGIFGYKRATCSTCRHAFVSMAYARMQCEFRPETVDRDSCCIRFAPRGDAETREDEWEEGQV